MRDMTWERLALVKTSGPGGEAVGGGEFEAAFGFFGRVNEHPVVKAGPLRIAGIQLFIAEFAYVRAKPGLGGETAQYPRPAAAGGFVAVGMQAGVEIGNRTSRADEGCFGSHPSESGSAGCSR